MVCVSRTFQRIVFVLSVGIFAALGMGFAMGEFGFFGVMVFTKVTTPRLNGADTWLVNRSLALKNLRSAVALIFFDLW